MVASSGAALNQRRVVIEIGLTGSGYLRTDTNFWRFSRYLSRDVTLFRDIGNGLTGLQNA
jgi:hypothetical protein